MSATLIPPSEAPQQWVRSVSSIVRRINDLDKLRYHISLSAYTGTREYRERMMLIFERAERRKSALSAKLATVVLDEG